MAEIDGASLCADYLERVQQLLRSIQDTEGETLDRAAARVADQVAADRLVHIYGPGGHSNLSAQEIFFRAGGLMHMSAILDEGTLISNGALRSMAIERTPGYGRVVIENQELGADDLLILVNSYGINAALIDAALEAKRRGVFLIGVSSRRHAEETAPEHPARHPTRQNLHDLVDVAVDVKVPIGDALIQVPGLEEPVGAVSTFANGFALNCIALRAITKLVERGVTPPVWRSGNAPGGDEANARFIGKFRQRVKAL
jgi:uncharacterized phosphosugar-binding protein